MTERRRHDGRPIGVDALATILAGIEESSAAATARGVQEAVAAASPAPIDDDAAILVLAVG